MGRTERGWAAGEGNGPSEVGRRPGAVLGLGKKEGELGWAGNVERREGKVEGFVFFVFFC
jgi:hypothetical protein